MTGPDGEVTTSTFTTDGSGAGTVSLTWPDGEVPGDSPLTAVVTGPSGNAVTGIDQQLVTDPDPEPTSTTTTTGDGQGTDASPWGIDYEHLEPNTEYTVTVSGPDGQLSTRSFTTDDDGAGHVDLTWPGPVPGGTRLTASIAGPDGTALPELDESQTTPSSQSTSTGRDQGAESNPWTIDYTGLSPDTEYTVAVQGPDGQVTDVTFTTDAAGDGTAQLSWPEDAVAPGTQVTAVIRRDGTPLSTLDQPLTVPADPTATTTSTGDGQGTADSPWTIDYTDLAPNTGYTVAVTGPDGELSTTTFTTDSSGSATASLQWPAGVPTGTPLTASLTREDGTALPQLDQTQTTPSAQSTSSGAAQGSDANPWTIDYTDLSPDTEYTVTVRGPGGQVTEVTFTTDSDGDGTAQLSWPDGDVPPGTGLIASVSRDGVALSTLDQPLVTDAAAPADPHSVTISSGDDQGSESNPWTIEYTGLEPDTEYTVTVTGPDGQLTQVTITTDHTGSAHAQITWPEDSVPEGTTLTASIAGPDGQTIPGIDQSLTTAQDEPEPTPEPTEEPTPEPTEEPTEDPTPEPTEEPTPDPTEEPTEEPTPDPTEEPTPDPTEEPTEEPTPDPTEEPTPEPTPDPTEEPTEEPTEDPTAEPTPEPTAEPTAEPTDEPTEEPTEEPTPEPTEDPTEEPTPDPTENPTEEPTEEPTPEPTEDPTEKPSPEPSEGPSEEPTEGPTEEPTQEPTPEPSDDGSASEPAPSDGPSEDPAGEPSRDPSEAPEDEPTAAAPIVGSDGGPAGDSGEPAGDPAPQGAADPTAQEPSQPSPAQQWWGEELPHTGFSHGTLVTVGGILLLAGAGLVGVSRLRRRES